MKCWWFSPEWQASGSPCSFQTGFRARPWEVRPSWPFWRSRRLQPVPTASISCCWRRMTGRIRSYCRRRSDASLPTMTSQSRWTSTRATSTYANRNASMMCFRSDKLLGIHIQQLHLLVELKHQSTKSSKLTLDWSRCSFWQLKSITWLPIALTKSTSTSCYRNIFSTLMLNWTREETTNFKH